MPPTQPPGPTAAASGRSDNTAAGRHVCVFLPAPECRHWKTALVMKETPPWRAHTPTHAPPAFPGPGAPQGPPPPGVRAQGPPPIPCQLFYCRSFDAQFFCTSVLRMSKILIKIYYLHRVYTHYALYIDIPSFLSGASHRQVH